jgi:NTE family protein
MLLYNEMKVKKIFMLKYLKLTVVCFLIFSSAHAQVINKTPYDNLKLGLVLSGGGARGLAHVGVLEVLDSLGIRPSYITGTSMGSIVGGLYSIGYSGKEIREIVTKLDWEPLLSDHRPLSGVDLKEKEILGRSMFSFSLKKKRFQLPSGILQGHHIIRMLDSLVSMKSVPKDFDQFPIPFRAITTDLMSGSTYVFDHGELSIAMRASMAIPTAFTPVRYQGKVLVDGGVIDNLPIEEIRNMGADVVLAVNVGYIEQPTEGDLSSLVGVLNKVSTLYGRNETFRTKKDADYLLQPNLKDYSITAFGKSSEIIQLGYLAAQQKADILEQLPHKRFTKYNDSLIRAHKVLDIEYYGIPEETAEVFNHRLNFKKGVEVDQKELSRWLSILDATDRFHWIQYSFEEKAEGSILKLHFNKKERRQVDFRLAYHNSSKLEMAIQYQAIDSTLINRRFLSVLNLSSTPDFLLSYEFYFGDKRHVGIENRILFENQYIPIYQENDRLGTLSLVDLRQEVNVNYYLSQNGRLQFSIKGEFDRMKPKDGLSLWVFENQSIGQISLASHIRYTYNTLNRSFLPKSGWLLDMDYNVKIPVEVSDEEEIENELNFDGDDFGFFSQLNFTLLKPFALNNRWTFTVDMKAGLSFSSMNSLDRYILGGIHSEEFSRIIPVAGVGYGQYVANSYYALGASLRYRIGSDFFVRGKCSVLGAADEPVQSFESEAFYVPAIDVGVGYRSILGDMSFNFGYNFDDHHSYWNISFYPFR